MRKKGFTLIELLAVIVILAIIALIATPIIMNMIENSRKGAAERTADNYFDAVEVAVGTERVDGNVLDGKYVIQEDGNLCPETGCGDNNIDKVKIDMSGNKPSSGTIFIENGLVTTNSNMTIGDYTVSYDADKKAYEAIKGQTDKVLVTVYRWSKDKISIEQEIDPTDTTKFTTDPTTLGKDFYLKHTVENNVVTESYACAVFNIEGKGEEVCVQGGDPNYYGYAKNEANYAGNALILKGLQDEGFSCFFNAGDAFCRGGSVRLDADSYGRVDAGDGRGGNCFVSVGEGSYCDSL